jgi:hypothetical protein
MFLELNCLVSSTATADIPKALKNVTDCDGHNTSSQLFEKHSLVAHDHEAEGYTLKEVEEHEHGKYVIITSY